MRAQNLINGKVVESEELCQLLQLSTNDRCMIDVTGTFEEGTGTAPGQQLVLTLMDVKLANLTKATLPQYIQRLAFRDACGESPIELPEGIPDLIGLYKKLRGWLDKGWEMQTDLSHLEQSLFDEWSDFLISRSVVQSVKNLRRGVFQQLEKAVPEVAWVEPKE